MRFFSGKNSSPSRPSKDRINSAGFLGLLLKVLQWSDFSCPIRRWETLEERAWGVEDDDPLELLCQ
jgi:hypothetical protein